MGNHYHFLIETPDANLSRGMRQLNGVYTQTSNRNHNQFGHVFQGRFKGILVEKETYLLALARYIVLNPVRARMVRHAKDWPWSSYGSTSGDQPAPDWTKEIEGPASPSSVTPFPCMANAIRGKTQKMVPVRRYTYKKSVIYMLFAFCS